ncbi:MAG: hypothetical protein Q8936_16550 [Bacillota bacterium]|nr:hypothetical protein [Bacillota bacterium]
MDNNKLIGNSSEDNFIKHKENQIKKLDEKIQELISKIQEQKEKNDNCKIEIGKQSFENSLLKDRYENLKRFIRANGIFFIIENKGFRLHEWESLHLKNENGIIQIINHEGSVIHVFNEAGSNLIMEILEDKECNLVVVRIEKYKIKIQLRVKL